MTSAKAMILAGLMSSAMWVAAASAAAPSADVRSFNVPPSSVSSAVASLGRQAGVQILLPGRQAHGARANAVTGQMSVEQALSTMLRGTGLTARKTDANTYTIVRSDLIAVNYMVGQQAAPSHAEAAPTRQDAATSAAGAAAPEAPPAPEPAEITVTGTRIRNANFEAPTPVQAVGNEMILQRGTTNVANIINELPAFNGTLNPASTNLNSRQNGVNVPDLRGLGTNRNLVLINGRRGTPFDEYENVDLNVVPSLAIDRVEVVTGGASAAYGSDAVSGVINLIYNEKLKGLKLNAQYGISQRGDANDLRLAAAWGRAFGEGRGHILIAGDYNDNKGIPKGSDRAWQRRSPALLSNPADVTGSDGIPAYIFRDNAVLFLGSPNGVTLPGGPAGNLEFLPGGGVQTRQLGQIGGSLMVGGSGSRLADDTALYVPTKRFNVMAASHYDLTDHVTVFGEASFARSKSRGALIDAFTFGDVVITPDNPYLPASVAALNTAFPLFRTFSEFPPITSASKTDSMRFVGGLKGEFGKNWHWEVSGQYGQTDFNNKQYNNLIVGNLVKAADAVRSGGNIVCRVNADADPTNNDPACVPINLFGAGSPSQQAIAYITGTGVSDTRIKQSVFSADIGGELFENWAGPVLTSFGIERRAESLNRTVNALNATEAFAIVNAQPLKGRYHVTEGFAEIAMPLLSGPTKLDFNGAARYTNYSTVGDVVTWKAGLTFRPLEALRFRGTISRDIRAPSIGETFVTSTLLFSNLADPFIACGGAGQPACGATSLVRTPTSGNTSLRQETALTKTVGAVVTLGRFRGSVDWYDINLKGAIGALQAQDIVNRCFAGETSLCSQITFGPNKELVEVKQQNLNLGTYKVQGLDFEGRYSLPVANGTLSLGLVASYLIHKKIAPSGGTPIDVAGELGLRSGFGLPDFKGNISANFETRTWGAFAQVRYIHSGVYDATFGPEQLSNADNHIPAVAYVDMSVKYKPQNMFGGRAEIYAGIDNLLDKDPPVVPQDFIANSATNPAIYDVIGRKFYVGVRMNF